VTEKYEPDAMKQSAVEPVANDDVPVPPMPRIEPLQSAFVIVAPAPKEATPTDALTRPQPTPVGSVQMNVAVCSVPSVLKAIACGSTRTVPAEKVVPAPVDAASQVAKNVVALVTDVTVRVPTAEKLPPGAYPAYSVCPADRPAVETTVKACEPLAHVVETVKV
jgi:hypothetical protein